MSTNIDQAIDQQIVQQNVASALKEDLGDGDISAAIVPQWGQASAHVICRDAAVLCGQAWFDETLRQVDSATVVRWEFRDGDRVPPGSVICRLNGKASSLLSGERCALNFVQTLSATASLTRRYVDAMGNSGCRILDTRKTIPGLRLAQKYAVRCGGGFNHRMGLYDAILLKENHIIALGSVEQAVRQAQSHYPGRMVEIEVETVEQLRQAIAAGADRALLDNMDLPLLRECVKLAQQSIELEASGGVRLDTIAAIAATGVDFISVGDLTKNIQAVDLSMRFDDRV